MKPDLRTREPCLDRNPPGADQRDIHLERMLRRGGAAEFFLQPLQMFRGNEGNERTTHQVEGTPPGAQHQAESLVRVQNSIRPLDRHPRRDKVGQRLEPMLGLAQVLVRPLQVEPEIGVLHRPVGRQGEPVKARPEDVIECPHRQPLQGPSLPRGLGDQDHRRMPVQPPEQLGGQPGGDEGMRLVEKDRVKRVDPTPLVNLRGGGQHLSLAPPSGTLQVGKPNPRLLGARGHQQKIGHVDPRCVRDRSLRLHRSRP